MKTLTLNLVTSHVNEPFFDDDADGKPRGRKVVSLIAAEGEPPQTPHFLAGDGEFLDAAAVPGTPATVTITLGEPPAPENAPAEHV